MRALPAIVLVLLGAVAWFVLRDSEPVAATPTVANAANSPSEKDAAIVLPAPAIAPSAAIEPKRTDLAAPAKKKKPSLLGRLFGGAKEEPAEAEPPKIGVDCTVIVVDAHGGEYATESGTVTTAFTEPAADDDTKSSQRAWFSMKESEVTEGRFHVDVPPERLLDVRALDLGGRPAVAEGGPFAIAAGVPLTIRARWVETATLRVIDAASRVPLADVTVAKAGDGDYGQVHPGPLAAEQIVVEHGTSPVTLPPSASSHGLTNRGWVESCWVGAAGHAWTKVEADFKRVAETVVELAAGATLVVDVRGELPSGRRGDDEDRGPKLRLRRIAEPEDFDEVKKESLAQYDDAQPMDFPFGRKPSLAEFERMLEGYRAQFEAQFEHGPLLAEFDAQLGETTIDGLPVGALSVSVEVGESDRTPLVAAAAAATLVAETTNRVTLTLAPAAPPPEPVPLSGTLYVPQSWDRGELQLEIEPITLRGATSDDDVEMRLRDMTAIAGRPRWFRWSAGTVQPATYRVTVSKAGFARQVEVAPPGITDVEIVLAEATMLIVRLVDDAIGTPIELDSLWGFAWHVEPAAGSFDFGSMIRLQTRGEELSAEVPVGRGGLVLYEIDWIPVSDIACDVRPGSQELVVRMRRACGLTLSLACDGAPISMESFELEKLTIEAIGHSGVQSPSTWTQDRISTRLTAPGRYRVTLADRGGYDPVEPFEIEIQDGEHVTKVIELKKKR